MTDHLPQRKQSLRLGGWNYTESVWYYVTICTHEKQTIFGSIRDESMHLNEIGIVVQKHWLILPTIRPNVTLDKFVIMPNHLHGLLRLQTPTKTPSVGSQRCCDRLTPRNCPSDNLGTPGGIVRPHSLSAIIRNFKSYTAREINSLYGERGDSVWQPKFHDHVVRSDADLKRIQKYIRDNPKNWKHDPDYHT